jgi:5'(3')-deoxyribonucleotidase
MTRAYLDLDGVLADFDGGLHTALGCYFCYDLWPYEYGPAGWDWYHELGLTLEDVDKLCDFDFWANLHWMPDGHDILRTVLGHTDTVTLITTPMPNVMSASGKVEWVRRNIPSREHGMMICLGDKTCSGLPSIPDAVLIDDCQENVDKWHEQGGQAILVPRPWNDGYVLREDAVEVVRHSLESLL